MCVYVHLSMDVCMMYSCHMYTCMHMYVGSMHVHVCVCVCMYVCMYVCIFVFITVVKNEYLGSQEDFILPKNIDSCMHACMHVLCEAATDICIHTYISASFIHT